MQYRSGPGPSETRNVIIAIVLSMAIFFGFEIFYNGPRQRELQAEQARVEEQQQEQASETTVGGVEGETPPAPGAPVTREQALASTSGARIVIDTGAVDGSISLTGARIDDLNLRNYRRTVEPDSEEVTLLAPMNTEFAHDAFFGWEVQSGEDVATLADASTEWTAQEGATLTTTTPVTLTRQAGPNLTIERTIAIDDNFMFTITDVVRNDSAMAVSVRPFGVVRREGLPQDYRQSPIVHQGLIGAFGPENHLQQANFQNAQKHARDKTRGRRGADERIEELQGTGGWFGVTDHYWLTAIIPDQSERVSAYFDSRPENNSTDFRTAYRGQWRDAPAGGTITYTQRLFAGAKVYELLNNYQNGRNQQTDTEIGQPIPRFDDAIDWGNFWFLTRPFFAMMHWLGQHITGPFSFGIAILLSTIVVKLLLFPLVYHSFKAMAKMRGLQPKMKELQEKYAADKQRQQQELLRLYQTEKINPVSGCLPILLQIPVFFALYKVLTNTIEMRHAPFYGWVNDLSARDPTSVFNLFGLIPYDPGTIPFIGSFLLIGALPIMYGISMWALQALSPPPTDPTQAQIFRLLPILFTFMFAAFPAGLVIYWTWSNTLSILQQYVIMRRQGVETQLDTFLKKRFAPEAGGVIAVTPEEHAAFIEAGRLLFAGPVNFELGVVDMTGLPDAELPEVAFAGRSNVGKSSLVNALTGRKGLARASTEPGRTRELNFFRMGDRLRLVDLPGYGYAKAGKADIKRWTSLTRDYLRGRAPLKRVVLLIDGRHGLKDHDKDVMDALDTAAVTYQIVFTKADKVKPTDLAELDSATRAAISKRPAAHPEIIGTSAETGAGIEQLRAEIAALARA